MANCDKIETRERIAVGSEGRGGREAARSELFRELASRAKERRNAQRAKLRPKIHPKGGEGGGEEARRGKNDGALILVAVLLCRCRRQPQRPRVWGEKMPVRAFLAFEAAGNGGAVVFAGDIRIQATITASSFVFADDGRRKMKGRGGGEEEWPDEIGSRGKERGEYFFSRSPRVLFLFLSSWPIRFRSSSLSLSLSLVD